MYTRVKEMRYFSSLFSPSIHNLLINKTSGGKERVIGEKEIEKVLISMVRNSAIAYPDVLDAGIFQNSP